MRFPQLTIDKSTLRFSAFAALAVTLLSGCSASAVRLNDTFSNPFTRGDDTLVTGSADAVLPQKPAALRKLTAAPRQAMAASAAPSPVLRSPLTPAPLTTGTIPGARTGGWVAEGGTPIVVAQGETAAILSMRYGVPEADMLHINGFNAAAQVQPGARLIIPAYSAGAAAKHVPVAAPAVASTTHGKPAPVVAAAKPRPAGLVAAAAVKQPAAHPFKIAKLKAPAKSLAPVVMAQAEPAAPAVKKTQLKKPVLTPVAALVPAEPVPAPAPAAALPVKKIKPPKIVAAQAPAVPVVPPAPAKVATAVVPAAPRAVDPATTASLPPAAPVATTEGNPEFRWPARGRIIQGFQGGAGGNDGINIAVPEGTSVKAAEGGVVAYAGSELKGYGNLVLIKHPNGFVSAYANNGSLEVKRGDQVKRGQIVAKSGQSGNVSSPQLHFELRKGSTPVDPTSYLAGL